MIVDCAVYEDGQRRPGRLELETAYEAGREDNAFVWIGLHEPSPQEFDSVRREFDLHELAVEDAIKAHQRPKLEVYGDSLFVVLKTVRYVDEEEAVEIGEIMLFVGDAFVVSVRHGEASALSDVRKAVEERPDLLRYGPGAVLHAIVDRVVDDYVPVLDGLDNDIQEVEREVFSQSRDNPAERLYKLKREVLEFHRAAAPLIEPLDHLARGRFKLVYGDIANYFRDVHDHTLRVVDQIESYRDLLTSIFEANLAQISVRQNEDMRRISAWVAIVAVPTLVAGIYGMNFEHMPELGWTWGYPGALVAMVTICTVLYRWFRRSGWL
ncbi:MAG TPA: magnesium/cobalt transporter CorA [Egibacteraceae bacterium]|nr:magnesium/cobalt transporter CorA [Egibacteraceae bacterium]